MLTCDDEFLSDSQGIDGSILSIQLILLTEVITSLPQVDLVVRTAIQAILQGNRESNILTIGWQCAHTLLLLYTRALTQDCEMPSILCTSLRVIASHTCRQREVIAPSSHQTTAYLDAAKR